ncbi:MAG TPA: hypothetical protein VN456_07570 [Desulfosporosinus sp.]|nr:hypothetical protein [Desulfosporosinus sp.]
MKDIGLVLPQVTMGFDSQWCGTIELVFEGVTAFNLRPAGDNNTADIWAASLIVKGTSVFFCNDGAMKSGMKSTKALG